MQSLFGYKVKEGDKLKEGKMGTYKVRTREIGKETERVYNTIKGDKEDLTVDEINYMYNDLLKQFTHDQIMVRVFGITHNFTIKSYADRELNLLSYDDYFRNRVKDISKFQMFFKVEITIMA